MSEAVTLRDRLLACLRGSPAGLTAHQLAEMAGEPLDLVKPVITRLKRARQIEEGGPRRVRGRRETVWKWPGPGPTQEGSG